MQKMIKILIISGIMISGSSVAQNSTKTVKDNSGQKWLNLNYADDNMRGHLLDIYLPAKGIPPYPVIVTIAGSAFFSDSSKHWAFDIGKPLLKHGFAIVAVNHRSSRDAIFPAQINDIKGVVRFLRANAQKYNLDTNFVGITGTSSGGHLSAMMGTSGGVTNYTIGDKTINIEGDVGGNYKMSSHVDAVVDWFGPTAFQIMDSCGSTMVHDAPDSPESTLIGGPIQENDELCALANPITYIDKNDPPFLIIHGDADPLVPNCQSIILHEALRSKDVENKIISVPGGGHGDGVFIDKYIEKMIKFFLDNLYNLEKK
jgi:acetyl esterase/lipase